MVCGHRKNKSNIFKIRVGRPVPSRPGKPRSGPSGPGTHFGSFLRGSLKMFLRSFSESRNHPCKDFHGLSAPFRHFRLNILRSRFWLITGVRTVPVATVVADHSGCGPTSAITPDHVRVGFEEKTCYFCGGNNILFGKIIIQKHVPTCGTLSRAPKAPCRTNCVFEPPLVFWEKH